MSAGRTARTGRAADRACLFRRLDPRCDDALGAAAIEQAPDYSVLPLRHSDERRHAKIACGRAQLRRDLERDSGVPDRVQTAGGLADLAGLLRAIMWHEHAR